MFNLDLAPSACGNSAGRPRFRIDRVLLAGDAAHVYSPVSGLGMNCGIQDAHNLAWKLAAALGGGDVDRLLDSYDVERRAVIVGEVPRDTDALTRALSRPVGRIRDLLDGNDGWILVRPDAHVAWARRTLETLEADVAFALGESPPREMGAM